MNKKINIGITEITPAWEILFEQLGVCYSIINWNNFSDNEYSCIVITSYLYIKQKNIIDQFLQYNGLIIDTTNHFKFEYKTKYKRCIVDTKGILEKGYSFDVYSFVRHFKQGDKLFDGAVAFYNYRNGTIASIGFNCEKIISNKSSKRKFFLSPSKVFPDEIVNKNSKFFIRKMIEFVIIKIHLTGDIPFVKICDSPKNRSIFLLRIDTDFSSKQDLILLKNVCSKNGIKSTWFVHSEAHENYINLFNQFENDEIAVHTHSHKLFDNEIEQSVDINCCKNLLEENGLKVYGFAAPFGAWSNNLAIALNKFDFKYSSEFSLDYDNLPYHFNNRLQIPIHPICIGSFKRTKATDEEILNYFKKVIYKKYSLQEPILLYYHPLDGRLNVLELIFEYINKLNINNYTFNEYSEWLLIRQNANFGVNTSNIGVEVKGNLDSTLKLILYSENNLIVKDSTNNLNVISIKSDEIIKEKNNFLTEDKSVSQFDNRRPFWRNIRNSIEDYISKNKI